jgi:hypothetical protein
MLGSPSSQSFPPQLVFANPSPSLSHSAGVGVGIGHSACPAALLVLIEIVINRKRMSAPDKAISGEKFGDGSVT